MSTVVPPAPSARLHARALPDHPEIAGGASAAAKPVGVDGSSSLSSSPPRMPLLSLCRESGSTWYGTPSVSGRSETGQLTKGSVSASSARLTMALAIPCAVAPAGVEGAVWVVGAGGGVPASLADAAGRGPAVAAPPVEETVTAPSSLVTVKLQSSPPAGQEKRTPPASRCAPAGTVRLPPGLCVSQLSNPWRSGSATAWSASSATSPRNTKSSTASGAFVSTVRPGRRV